MWRTIPVCLDGYCPIKRQRHESPPSPWAIKIYFPPTWNRQSFRSLSLPVIHYFLNRKQKNPHWYWIKIRIKAGFGKSACAEVEISAFFLYLYCDVPVKYRSGAEKDDHVNPLCFSLEMPWMKYHVYCPFRISARYLNSPGSPPFPWYFWHESVDQHLNGTATSALSLIAETVPSHIIKNIATISAS